MSLYCVHAYNRGPQRRESFFWVALGHNLHRTCRNSRRRVFLTQLLQLQTKEHTISLQEPLSKRCPVARLGHPSNVSNERLAAKQGLAARIQSVLENCIGKPYTHADAATVTSSKIRLKGLQGLTNKVNRMYSYSWQSGMCRR